MLISIIQESTKIVIDKIAIDGAGMIKGELWSWLLSEDNLLIEIPVGYEWEEQYNQIIAYFGGKEVTINSTTLVQINQTIRQYSKAHVVIGAEICELVTNKKITIRFAFSND